MLEVTGVRGFHLTSRLKYDIAEKLTLGVYDTYRWLVSKNTDFLEIDHSLLEMPLRGLELEKVPIAFFEFKTLQSS